MLDTVQIQLECQENLPKLVPVEQSFKRSKTENISEAIHQELSQPGIKRLLKPGSVIAVAVGSRGIANINKIVFYTIRELQRMGANPFIIPAMGSHGGATAEGQADLLSSYGINQKEMGVPVVSSMETVQVSETDERLPIFMDKQAFMADGIVLIARVKPHTDFKGEFESGLMKMLAIGLGKHKGAAQIHSQGFDQFSRLLPLVGQKVISHAKVLFGLALIENAFGQIARLEAVAAGDFFTREPQLLREAKENMATIIPREFDLLLVEELGKDISGDGMDPNVVGRPGSGLPVFSAPTYQKAVAFDLTEKTRGNACGIGLVDVITRNLFNKIDLNYTYANAITSTLLNMAKIPVVVKTERDAIQVALQCCNRVNISTARIVFIKNTLELERILVSEPLMASLQDEEKIKIIGEAIPMDYDENGRLNIRPSLL